MGASLKFDSDRRELVRERRQARLERKQQRRQAREHKRYDTTTLTAPASAAAPDAARERRMPREAAVAENAGHDRDSDGGAVSAVSPPEAVTAPALPAIEPDVGATTPPEEPTTAVDDTPAATLTPAAAEPNTKPPAEIVTVATATAARPKVPTTAAERSRPVDRKHLESREPRRARRERDVAEFLARREEALSQARAEARERIERVGEEEAVCDALVALAHPEASPWRRHRERLAETIAGGRIPDVGAAARRACRGTAGDAARTSRRAPDPQLALAVTVAYAVIARAPWVAVRGARAKRSHPRRDASPRAFWR
jgi:hypothetical protein